MVNLRVLAATGVAGALALAWPLGTRAVQFVQSQAAGSSSEAQPAKTASLPSPYQPDPIVVKPVGFAISPRVADLPAARPQPEDAARFGGEFERENRQVRSLRPDVSPFDGALQLFVPPRLIPSPIVSFDGLSSADNFIAFGFRVYPSDTNGDVGPNHYVQMTNLLVRVFDKTGTPLTAPFKLSSLFSGLGGQCAAPDAGDPIVLYDPLADRWLLSQFAFAAINAPPYHECVALSQTGDPTGAYSVWDFVTPGNEFPDYPKLGVWPDAYYMSTVQFLNGGAYDGVGAFAFNRAKMLAGDPTAEIIYFNRSVAVDPAAAPFLPADFDGLTPPPAGAPNTFAAFAADDFGDPFDGLRLWDFSPNFVTPASSTFTLRPESTLAVAPFGLAVPPGRRNIRQPPSPPAPAPGANDTMALDAIADRLLHPLQYRRAGSVESLVVSHTVGAPASTTLGTYRAGVRWYNLTRPVGGNYAVLDQGTFAPADTVNRWMSSAAVDWMGNLAIGFSVSDGIATMPGIEYAGRLATDPPGTLAQGSATLIAGTGVQRGTASRWGDYSALAVDPLDDCTFWFTTEYYSAASQATSTIGWLTRIGSFKFNECTPVPKGTLQGTITNANTMATLAGANIQVSNGFGALSGGAGTYTRTLAPGTYSVTISKFGFAPQTFPSVTITNGGTTVLNAALVPVAVMAPDLATLTAESFPPPNGVVDPGEIVTFDFRLINNGTVGSTSLVATLLPGGGVLSPSGPQNYGAIAPAGTATRSFSFRASPALLCGDKINATLQLQDGPYDLGTVVFQINTGVVTSIFAQNFDGVVAPALPAGWTAANASGPAPLWVTTTSTPDAGPNAAFIDDPAVVSDKRLDSPAIAIAGSSATLTFRNNYNLEATYDGGVLEISINGGPFVDIITAGGSFVTGGYTSTISTGFSNPIGGRMAWSGNSGGYITTTVRLPAAAAGGMVVLRWRMGSDNSVAATGWRVDTISITETSCDAASGEFVRNGTFTQGADGSDFWLKFALPDPSGITWNVTGGVMQFYRTGTQATVYQETGVPVSGAVEGVFDLGNSSSVRKRVSVLILDSDFSDLFVCTFWLPPGQPLMTYRMRTHTTKPWANTAIYFYAATVGSNGGFYRIDNVSLKVKPAQSTKQTECVDPNVPAPPGGAPGPELLVNGSFSSGLPPWFVFGTKTWQIASGVFEFIRPNATPPAGVVAQQTGQAMTANQLMTATFQLGNSSGVRKRVTVILGDFNFTDLTACTFWLAPGQPLGTYTMRGYATQAWTDALVSFYASTIGPEQWSRLDNASFMRTPASGTVGTTCIEPGGP